MKYSSKRILVGIEDFESSTPVLDYVADLASGNEDFVVYAFHAIGPVPLELREFRGAEDPKTEDKLDAQFDRKREEWIQTAKNHAQPLLENARVRLSAKGIPETTVTTHVSVLDHNEDFISEILETASRIGVAQSSWDEVLCRGLRNYLQAIRAKNCSNNPKDLVFV
jgi:hypothetical protein